LPLISTAGNRIGFRAPEKKLARHTRLTLGIELVTLGERGVRVNSVERRDELFSRVITIDQRPARNRVLIDVAVQIAVRHEPQALPAPPRLWPGVLFVAYRQDAGGLTTIPDLVFSMPLWGKYAKRPPASLPLGEE
jgi:hypothetical protein